MRKIELITDESVLKIEKIEESLKHGDKVIVQYSKKCYRESELRKLNLVCLNNNTNLTVRFYSHYFSIFDCSILNEIPNVKSLEIDTEKVSNITLIRQLENLEKFRLSVINLEEFDFLEYLNIQKVKELNIGQTFSKKLDLSPLKNYKNLTFLTICGHSKNIDIIGEIVNLEKLDLISINKSVRLAFINKLNRLQSLRIFLGGRTDIREIENCQVEELQIDRVQGIENLDNLNIFTNLKRLIIEDQSKLTKLDFSELEQIEHIGIINCKTLLEIKDLSNLTKLEKLVLIRTNIDFDSLIQKGLPKNLNEFAFSRNGRINKEIDEKIAQLGYKEYKFWG